MVGFVIIMIVMCLFLIRLGDALNSEDEGIAWICMFFGFMLAIGICMFTFLTNPEMNKDTVSISEEATVDEILDKGIVVLKKNEDDTYDIWDLNMEDPKEITIGD